jgi:hypothetical protein
MPLYSQDFLPGFLEAEAETREAMISETERQVFLAKQFCRYDNMQKVCKSESMIKMLEKAKRDIIKLMQRC